MHQSSGRYQGRLTSIFWDVDWSTNVARVTRKTKRNKNYKMTVSFFFHSNSFLPALNQWNTSPSYKSLFDPSWWSEINVTPGQRGETIPDQIYSDTLDQIMQRRRRTVEEDVVRKDEKVKAQIPLMILDLSGREEELITVWELLTKTRQ